MKTNLSLSLLFVYLAFFSVTAFAKKPSNSEIQGIVVIASVMTLASTDLTNLSKSDYTIYADLTEPNVKNALERMANRDLCKSPKFKVSAGEVACQKPIRYKVVYNPSKADIFIIDNPSFVVSNYKQKLSVFIGNTDKDYLVIVDLSTKSKFPSLKVRQKKMKEAGFFPDPTLKFRQK